MIQLQHINKYYGKFHILKDVSLHVQKGEIYGLIGKNGAGKTTIFKIILGLTNFENGELTLIGATTKQALQRKRQKIGFYIGQNFFGYLNAKDNLRYYCDLKGIEHPSQEIERVLNIVGLKEVKRPFKSFSMGMKQRLGIANALLGNPDILILDEPTNGLDPQGIMDIRKLIKKLNQDYQMTIIVSSHILSELEHTANRFGIVHEGKIMREISSADLEIAKDSVEIQVTDLARAKEVLQANNIKILREGSQHKSLEDYYFELVGEKHE